MGGNEQFDRIALFNKHLSMMMEPFQCLATAVNQQDTVDPVKAFNGHGLHPYFIPPAQEGPQSTRGTNLFKT